MDTDEGRSAWLDDLDVILSPWVFAWRLSGPIVAFMGEVHVHETPKTASGEVLWICLRWAVGFIYGKQLVNNMLSRYAPSWVKPIESLGCPSPGENLRCSAKALAATCRGKA